MMSPEAKRWLSKNVHSLRERLLTDLRGEVDGQYKWQLPLSQAVLTQEQRKKRQRLEAWLSEQARGCTRGLKESEEQARERHLQSAVKLAGATLLNRLVVIRQMETLELTRVKLVTRGWASPDYADFRRDFAPALGDDGFELLLNLLFEELALDLPGLFGEVGATSLIPVSTATLRHVLETLEARELSDEDRRGLWMDDTLLGWVYQFWNDPERDALDGKVETHQLAAKTQCFTDRYMVEWLLQNSLGQLWLGMCNKNGWTPEVVSAGTLDALESRRGEWREKRQRGEVDLEALMPLHSPLEDRWKYWVPRTLPDPHANLPTSLRSMRLLDPACGSGHFLVTAFDLLVALYEEEARQRGESWTPEQIAIWILENNLHGIDIDTRAVQIAGAALWLKMKRFCPQARVERLNLVSSDFGLGRLGLDQPEVRDFVRSVEEETGIPARLVDELVSALKDADHLGSLLRVDKVFDKAVASVQGLFDTGDARAILLERLEDFVQSHSGDEDLSQRLLGQSLARSSEFLRLNREGTYDLVVGNPPYLEKSRIVELTYLDRHYVDGKANLYSAFLLRALELAKTGGISTLLTLRGWMFLNTFGDLRLRLLGENRLNVIGDLDRGAFEDVLDEVVSVSITSFVAGGAAGPSVAQLPTPREDSARDNRRTSRKIAALLAGVGKYDFHVERLKVVPEQPLTYWWDTAMLADYARYPKIIDVARARKGICTGNDARFHRLWFEQARENLNTTRCGRNLGNMKSLTWQPGIKGAKDRVWFEPLTDVIMWRNNGLELQTFGYSSKGVAIRNPNFYFHPGVAFSMIGSGFTARAHRFCSIFGNMGSSVFPESIPNALCLMNSAKAKYVLTSLNPGVHFEVGDVNRLPLFPIESADEIVAQLDAAFTQHEQARETSVEFVRPGPSVWNYAQQWAQQAIDRDSGTVLPPYQPVEEQPGAGDHFSYAVGLAIGRFSSEIEPLPNGILFLTGQSDSLEHPATQALHQVWRDFPLSKLDLRAYLKNEFFSKEHLKRYEKRPIYFPLSSEKRNFVAYVSIHRWQDSTLDILLADYLQPELSRLGAELSDLSEARTQGDRKAQSDAEKRYQQVSALTLELQNFIDTLRAVAERGAPPSDAKCRAREVDAPFRMDLDDGVMINSAGLWPLLAPQWKDPKEWWKELCADKGVYDWAHLTMRYFPERVTAKCQQDPSLAVAHGVFWKYHPAKAMEWELRLQDPEELGPDFRLDEPGSGEFRAAFLAEHPERVRELRLAEEKRRAKKADKAVSQDQGELDFEEDDSSD